MPACMEIVQYLQLMPNPGLQVEVVVDQLYFEASVVCNEGIVASHTVVQMGNALLQILHLPLHHLMPAAYLLLASLVLLCGA